MTIDFEIKESDLIKDVWIITPSISRDLRGNIWSSFIKEKVENLLPKNLIRKASSSAGSCVENPCASLIYSFILSIIRLLVKVQNYIFLVKTKTIFSD
jgi:hypothetical protein